MKFKTKQVTVEAFRFNSPADLEKNTWAKPYVTMDANMQWRVDGKQGTVSVSFGDWIIQELDGSGAYPCADDVFKAKYEAEEAKKKVSK